jgi:glycosyl transferase family 25
MNEKFREDVAVLVIHVSSGYEQRAEHIQKMLGEKGIPFTFVLEGDKSELTPEVLDDYFADRMHQATAETSCTYKHLLAYECIVKEKLPGALVLEDDIVFYKRFISVFNQTLDELSALSDAPAIISYESSRLRFVPRSQRVKGQRLYPGDRDRMAGAYYINQAAARLILSLAHEEKCRLPIDLWHRQLLENHQLTYYWCQPTIAVQGSFTGRFRSSLSSKKEFLPFIFWFLKLNYKLLLYFVR